MKIFVLVLLFGAASWLFVNSENDQTIPEASTQEEAISSTESHPARATRNRPKTSLSARAAPQSSRTDNQTMNEDEFVEALRSGDLESVINLNDIVQKLRAQDPYRVAKYFSNRLSLLGSSNSQERGRLFHLANALQSDALLPFWQDLAERKTPAYGNESELLNAPEASLDSRVVLSEMSMAVRNLGLISYRDPAAGEILRKIALHPKQDIHTTLIRQYAYEALKESDQVASMQIIRSLKKDDSLKKRLISDASVGK